MHASERGHVALLNRPEHRGEQEQLCKIVLIILELLYYNVFKTTPLKTRYHKTDDNDNKVTVKTGFLPTMFPGTKTTMLIIMDPTQYRPMVL